MGVCTGADVGAESASAEGSGDTEITVADDVATPVTDPSGAHQHRLTLPGAGSPPISSLLHQIESAPLASSYSPLAMTSSNEVSSLPYTTTPPTHSHSPFSSAHQ